MSGNAVKKTDGECPDGYTGVWIWCIQKTVINKLTDPLQDIQIPDFTDPSCEAAVAAFKTLYKTVKSAIEVPKRYLNLLKKLVEYPFDVAEDMVKGALSAIDQVNKAIEELLSGVMSAANDLKNAMEHILSCPYLVDTAIGALAAEIIDLIDSADDYKDKLNELKKALYSTAKDYLDSLEETPLKAINNLKKAYNDMLKRSGIYDLLNELKKLEQCVEQLCAAWADLESFKNRLPGSTDELMQSLDLTWKDAQEKSGEIVTNTASNTVTPLANAADKVSAMVKLK